MESSSLSGARKIRVAPLVVGVVVAVVAVWVVVAVSTFRTPEDVVEDYLTAIADKDVEGALELVTRLGYGVPYGERAAFLTPDAISDDWWVVSVTELEREYGSEARVKAVIAGPGGTSEGEFTAREDDGEWLLSDPFAKVRFPASPLTYLRVNDKIVTRSDDWGDSAEYTLFPGLYRFYQSVPDVVKTSKTDAVAAFPPPESALSSTVPKVVPAALTPGSRAVERMRRGVRQQIDDCAEFATPTPYGDCPFATDGEIDTPDGKRVTKLRGLKWTVASYPVVDMADDRIDQQQPGFGLRTVEPGTVTLSGSGLDTEDKVTTFTVTCDIDLTGFQGTVGANGDVEISKSAVRGSDATVDTCRRPS